MHCFWFLLYFDSFYYSVDTWLESTTEILVLTNQNNFYLLTIFKLLVILHIIKLNAHINVYKKYYFKSSQNHFPKRDHTWKWNIKKWSVRISIFCPWQIICPILLTCLLPVLRDLNIVNFFLIPVMLKSCQQKSFVK